MNKVETTKLFESASPGVHDKVIQLLRNESRGKLLDAPAGSGAISKRLKDLGFEVIAADLNPEAFVLDDIDFKKIDLNRDLPFNEKSFDYIVCVEGIEHLENPFHLIREFRRLLNSGGKLILTTPNLLNLHSRLRYFLLGSADWIYERLNKCIPLDRRQFLQQHINPIGFHKLKYILERNNFSIEGIYTNKSILFYPGGKLFLKPFVTMLFFFCTLLVYLMSITLRRNDLLVKNLLSAELLWGDNLILKTIKR